MTFAPGTGSLEVSPMNFGPDHKEFTRIALFLGCTCGDGLLVQLDPPDEVHGVEDNMLHRAPFHLIVESVKRDSGKGTGFYTSSEIFAVSDELLVEHAGLEFDQAS